MDFGGAIFFYPSAENESRHQCLELLDKGWVIVLGHLRDGHRLRAAAPPQSETGIRSLRVFEKVLEEVQSVLPGACSEAQSAQGWRRDHCFPSMVVSTRL